MSAPEPSFLPVQVALVLLPWTLLFLFVSSLFVHAAWALKEPLRSGAANVAHWRERERHSLTNSGPAAFARTLRAYSWTSEAVTSGAVTIVVSVAAVFSTLVAANVVGLERPAFGERWLPWILGLALMAVIAECWPVRAEPRFALRLASVSCAFLAVIGIAVMKAEASIVSPAIYGEYHPYMDFLLGPFWIALEVSYFLAGGALGRAGLEHALRLIGWCAGVLIEAVVVLAVAAVNFGAWLLAFLLLVFGGAIAVLFLPAALLWAALRRAAGSDLDGNHRIGPLPGDEPHNRSTPRKERR